MTTRMNMSVPRKAWHCGVFCTVGVHVGVVIQNIRPGILETSVIMVILEVLCVCVSFFLSLSLSLSFKFRVVCFIITSWLPSMLT